MVFLVAETKPGDLSLARNANKKKEKKMRKRVKWNESEF